MREQHEVAYDRASVAGPCQQQVDMVSSPSQNAMIYGLILPRVKPTDAYETLRSGGFM